MIGQTDSEVMSRLNSMSTIVLEMFSISRVEIKLSSWLVVINLVFLLNLNDWEYQKSDEKCFIEKNRT